MTLSLNRLEKKKHRDFLDELAPHWKEDAKNLGSNKFFTYFVWEELEKEKAYG